MKKTIRKSLALLLAVLMLVSVSPMSFADMYPCPNCGEKTEMVSIDEQPATCLLPGRESGLFCTKCKQFVIGGEVIPITDHDYQSYAGETVYCSGSAAKDRDQCSVCKA